MSRTEARAGAGQPARIGPNALTRVAQALEELHGRATAERVMREAGLGRYLAHPPEQMVDEQEVVALHTALRALEGPSIAREAGARAGTLTAEYLLAHRIPRGVAALLRLLPPGLASPLLLRAIGGHAWTFAGSARFEALAGHPVRLRFTGCAVCRGAVAAEPLCHYYAATFERLYRALVSPEAVAREVQCQGLGAPACLFEIRWR